MQTRSRSRQSTCHDVDGACAGGVQRHPRKLARCLAAWAIGGVAASVVAVLLAHAVSEDRARAHELEAFRFRVTGGAPLLPSESPADALARRYLPSLEPAERQRITDQVRSEQKAGTTAQGRNAFMLRRLELYEAAFQRSRAISTGSDRELIKVVPSEAFPTGATR